jgi:hypothetical protein
MAGLGVEQCRLGEQGLEQRRLERFGMELAVVAT